MSALIIEPVQGLQAEAQGESGVAGGDGSL